MYHKLDFTKHGLTKSGLPRCSHGLCSRSQITIFIIAGMMVVLAVGLLYYVVQITMQSAAEKEISSAYSIESSLSPVETYVGSCISETAKKKIVELAAHGGTSNPENYRSYYGDKINYLCMYEEGAGCRSTILTKAQVEDEIARAVEEGLPECVDLEIFRKQGYSVEGGAVTATAVITQERVMLNVTYPITFTKEEQAREISSFDSDIRSSLGKLFQLSLWITNKEASDGYFDTILFLKGFEEGGSNLIIEKHRPYPDIIYSLTYDGLAFNFAVRGGDTSSQPGLYLSHEARNLGCCYTSWDSCYINAGMADCNAKSGMYDPNPMCTCSPGFREDPPEAEAGKEPRASAESALSGELKDCLINDGENIYTRKNYESWCEYDGIAGYGFDNVGSRHYLKYCIDGEVYTEECRDYREELCTEESGLTTSAGGYAETTRAICRDNRWLDCYKCTTEDCCLDTSKRDCFWLENSTVTNKCVPFVPPGFRHWENSGRDACFLAFEEKTCSGLSCGNDIINDAAMSCYMRGDCGNYWNTEGKVTYGGFFHTDISASSDPSVYRLDSQAGIIGLGKDKDTKINLGVENRDNVYSTTSLEPASDSFAKIISSVYSIIGAVSGLSETQDGSVRENIHVTEVSICEPWKAPRNADDCEKCGSESSSQKGFKPPCSEYLCRSLGQGCVYEEKDGYPICKKAESIAGQERKFVITAGNSSLPQGYSLRSGTVEIGGKTYNGHIVEPDLKPYRAFSLGINTTRESICRVQFAPKAAILSSGGYYFGEPEFSTSHKMTIRVPERPLFPDKLYGLMNTSSAKSFSDQFSAIMLGNGTTGLKGLYEKLAKRPLESGVPATGERLFNGLLLLSSDVDFYREVAKATFDKFEKGGYYMFVYCEDATGKVAEQPLFFDITISSNKNDSEPPQVLSFKPGNMSRFAKDADSVSFKAYLDEPAECRYSSDNIGFSDMNKSLSCPDSGYSVSSEFGGSYICSGRLDRKEAEGGIFIRCLDSPRKSVSYSIIVDRQNTAASGDNPGGVPEDVPEDAPGDDSSGAEQAGSTDPIVEGGSSVWEESAVDDVKAYMAQGISITGGAESRSGSAILYSNEDKFYLGIYSDEDMACRSTIGAAYTKNGTCTRSLEPLLGNYLCLFEVNLNDMITSTASDALSGSSGFPELPAGNLSSEEVTGQAEAEDGPDLPSGLGGGASPLQEEFGEVYNILITCEEKSARNRNEVPYGIFYILQESEALGITAHGPSGEVNRAGGVRIFVNTTLGEGVSCRYYAELNLGSVEMRNSGNMHYRDLPYEYIDSGTNEYVVLCKDSYGNTAEQEIEFYMME